MVAQQTEQTSWPDARRAELLRDRSAPISHDRLFKRLCRDFFPELLALFCPDWLYRLDLRAQRFVDKELLSEDPAAPPQVDNTEADLVALLHTLPQEPLLPGLEDEAPPAPQVLIHTEIQESSDGEPIAERVYEYNHRVQREHRVAALSLLLWFGPGRAGVADEVYQQAPLGGPDWTLRFRFRRVGIRGLRAADFLSGQNPLGYALAARMDAGALTRWELRALCEQRIAAAPLSAHQRYWLVNCVRTYLVLSIDEERRYRSLRERTDFQEVKAMELTWDEKMWYAAEERGEKRGEKRGALLAQYQMIQEYFTLRFGPMPADLQSRLEQAQDSDRLQRLRLALWRADSLSEALAAFKDL